MPRQALFAGLVVDEFDRPVEVTYVGDEPCYVVDDNGFLRHISAEQVDRQVLEAMQAMIEDHEDLIADQTAKMLGQEDPFSRAMIEAQLKQLDQHFDALLNTGIPEESRAYMGMMGFQVKINVHGEVISVEQPGSIDPEQGGEE
jgi:hypothetical protein